MTVLITYDVATDDRAGARRLRRVARACLDFGVRVQKSVFECQVGEKEWVTLRARLIETMDVEKDTIRFYFLDQEAMRKAESHGLDHRLDLNEPIVV